ncbi:MAG: ImmA/IrrE family metallo-endopeptidase [Acidobacteria bacterium]|nr:MAG: ImmA/IrrE family metallo-endopeptidase [Acidobacteriota bacterium]
MRNVFLRDYTAGDINDLVDKVLRDLGHPDPPLNLDAVRELLRLDRQYYSSTEDGVLRDVAHRLKVAGRQVLDRPMLLFEAIRKFDLRSLFLPDGKRILIDQELPDAKQRWSEGHEIGHSIIPWHLDTMLGDNKRTLTPACHEKIENEANFAAGQLLFLHKAFVRDAGDLQPGIDAVTTLKKRYGNTITTTLWRYVERSEEPMVGGISFHPRRLSAEFDPKNPFRYFVGSRTFQERFANVREDELFKSVRSYCANRRGGQLGASDLLLSDDNGIKHVFHFETFFNQYEALTLGIYKCAHARIVTVES